MSIEFEGGVMAGTGCKTLDKIHKAACDWRADYVNDLFKRTVAEMDRMNKNIVPPDTKKYERGYSNIQWSGNIPMRIIRWIKRLFKN
jgi:hypothetical protein